MVKNLPAQAGDIETQVPSLGGEDSMEEGTAAHSSILAWRIPMDRRAWRATVHRVAKSRTRLKQLRLPLLKQGIPKCMTSFPPSP